MQLTNRTMIVTLSVLAGLATPLTWLSTSADQDKKNQPAGQVAQLPVIPAALEILDSTIALTLQVSSPPNPGATTTIYLRNDGDQDIKNLTFSAALQDENGKSYSLSTPPSPDESGDHIGTIESQNKTNSLGNRSIKSFELRIKLDRPLPVFDGKDTFIPHTLAGYLTVKGDDKLIKNRPLKLIQAAPSYHAAYPVWFGLICSFAIVVLSVFIFKLGLNKRMGLPEWTASGSLATNLTAAGGILTALVASTALPPSTHILQKSEYNTLGLLFGVLVLLAPIIYNSIRLPSTQADATPQDPYEGYVGMFLLTCLVTLWGVFGQLATVWYLIGELWEARYMTEGAVTVFRICIAFVMALLFIYAFVAIRIKVHKSKTPVPVPQPPAAGIGRSLEVSTVALPKWRLL